jgi:thioredoxin-dependent peroxiredoxin
MATRRTATQTSATRSGKQPTKKAAPKASAAKKATAKKAVTKATPKPAGSGAKAPAKKAKAASAPPNDDVGTKLPDFRLSDQSGAVVTRKDLLGSPFVLYFYPKDDTPGCTTEACDFRDKNRAFEKLDCRVVGVSPDATRSHERFAQKYDLPFTLLSDPDKLLANALGVWQLKKNYGKEYMGIVRSTFLVDAEGRVARAWRGVKVSGHAEQVLEALGALG